MKECECVMKNFMIILANYLYYELMCEYNNMKHPLL